MAFGGSISERSEDGGTITGCCIVKPEQRPNRRLCSGRMKSCLLQGLYEHFYAGPAGENVGVQPGERVLI